MIYLFRHFSDIFSDIIFFRHFSDIFNNNKMEIEIKLDTSKTRKKGHPIIISIYVTLTDRQYPTTNFFATPDQWDDLRKEPKPNHPQYFSLYEFIMKKKLIINQLMAQNVSRTSQQLKNLILGNNTESLSYFWKEYITELRERKNDGQARYFESNLKALNQFNTDVLFKQIDYNYLCQYRDFHLSKVDEFGKKRVSNNGVIIYLRALRTVYNLAVKRKVFIPSDATKHFEGVIPKAEPTKEKDFSLQEMKKIVNSDKKNKYYDIFILCFLLGGIDYIDILNLRYDHIRNNRIKFVRHKGGTYEIINTYVYPEVWEILEKYKDESGYLMPFLQINEAKAENYSYRDNYIRRFRTWLKNNAEVTSYFTSKTPRYTFINLGKKLMLNRDILIEITGHSHGDVHAIYESRFPDHVRDEVQRTIIDAVLKKEMETI